MARTEGTQNIPSAWLDKYRATLGEQKPDKAVAKRYPHRLPTMQTKKGTPSLKQRVQRDRFLEARNRFRPLLNPERQRWFDSMPEWNSLLWYYNFFMLSALNDVLGTLPQGMSVIKKIENRQLTVPLGGTTITFATSVDPSKVVVMMWGAAYNHDEVDAGDYGYAWAWPVNPIWGTLTTDNISLTWGMPAESEGNVSLQIIEYI